MDNIVIINIWRNQLAQVQRQESNIQVNRSTQNIQTWNKLPPKLHLLTLLPMHLGRPANYLIQCTVWISISPLALTIHLSWGPSLSIGYFHIYDQRWFSIAGIGLPEACLLLRVLCLLDLFTLRVMKSWAPFKVKGGGGTNVVCYC